MTTSRWVSAILCGVVACAAMGCSSSSGDTVDNIGLRSETQLPARHGAVVLDGCEPDQWQRSTLAQPGAKRVIQEVIMLCLLPRLDGTIGPRDPSALAHNAAVIADLRKDGYLVNLGISFADETGVRYDGAQTRSFISDPKWRAQFIKTLPTVIAPADGIELDLQGLSNDARDTLTAFVTEISQAIRPAKKIGIFVPPSVKVPSDLPGGDAFARPELAKQVDRLRITTLDFSDKVAGPTTDPGWAVDAVRLAHRDAPVVDISYPLYGWDFGPRGRRSTTYFEAISTSVTNGAPIQRGPTTAPFVHYTSFTGEFHDIWFDDVDSTTRALGAWSFDVLPQDVGVLFYGLGAEEPALFERIAARTP